MRREVWERDGGECTFVGPDGHRCGQRGFLEYHHRVPYAEGGETSTENLTLHRVRHNAHQSEIGSVGTAVRLAREHQDEIRAAVRRETPLMTRARESRNCGAAVALASASWNMLKGVGPTEAEVTNVSPHGFWLLVDERELFVSFESFPWFHDATIRELARVERPSADHLYWPALDVDLALDSLEHPERYPLVSREASAREQPRTLRRAARKRRS